jgi:hypothetical protein
MANIGAYTVIGAREDLTSKLIQSGDETATIFGNFTMQTNATNKLHEWQDWALPSPAANAQLDGFTPSPSGIVRSRRSNSTQIFTRAFEVTNSVLEGLDIAGVANELEFQSQAYLKAMHRDINYALINNTGAVTGDGSAAAKFSGIFSSVTTNLSKPAATTSVFVESEILAMIKSIFDQTGEVSTNLKCFANSGSVNNILSFTGLGKTQYVTETTKEHNRLVTLIITNFGNITIIPDTMLSATGKLAILNMNYWALAWKRAIKMIPLAITKDARTAYWVTELTIEYLREKANAIMTGIVSTY